MLTAEILPPPAQRLDARVGKLLLRYGGEGPHEREPFVPDAAALAALRREVEAARADLAAAGPAEVPPPWRAFFADCLAGLATSLAADQARPARWVRGLPGWLLRTVN